MAEEIKNPLHQIWESNARLKAEEFAGEDVWEILDEVDRRYIIEVAKLVMRKEMALSGIV